MFQNMFKHIQKSIKKSSKKCTPFISRLFQKKYLPVSDVRIYFKRRIIEKVKLWKIEI